MITSENHNYEWRLIVKSRNGKSFLELIKEIDEKIKTIIE